MQLTPEQQAAIEQQKEHCPFCQIIAGKIPSKTVYEDDLVIAVLDINPLNKGHVLIMPKEHYPITPLIPQETQEVLYSRIREVSHFLRESLVNTHSTVFIANGQAAGQQSTHFLVHIIPSDSKPQQFHLGTSAHDDSRMQQVGQMLQQNLPMMVGQTQFQQSVAQPSPSEAPEQTPTDMPNLAEVIDQNPELKQAIINNPDAVLMGIQENPSLKPLFDGVDIHALSHKLRELEGQDQPGNEATPQPDIPSAARLSDQDLVLFINSKESLKNYLLNDLDTLKDALASQPRLQVFFSEQTPEQVRARYLHNSQSQEQSRDRRFGGDQ